MTGSVTAGRLPVRVRPAVVVGALTADVLAVLLFALLGRTSHGEDDSPAGLASTAWPFLAGLLVGWLAGRCWRGPLALRAGLPAWVGAALVGLGLRLLTLHRLPWSFAVVATVALGVLVLGWRLVAAVPARRRARDLAEPAQRRRADGAAGRQLADHPVRPAPAERPAGHDDGNHPPGEPAAPGEPVEPIDADADAAGDTPTAGDKSDSGGRAPETDEAAPA
jgi:hypothetical protein